MSPDRAGSLQFNVKSAKLKTGGCNLTLNSLNLNCNANCHISRRRHLFFMNHRNHPYLAGISVDHGQLWCDWCWCSFGGCGLVQGSTESSDEGFCFHGKIESTAHMK